MFSLRGEVMRIVAHLDMDAFFASVEEADSPIFKGKPIAVGSDPKDGKGRGVVSTANYKAREYGIHSALPVSTAWKLSEKAVAEGKPEVVFLPVNFERYREISDKVFQIIKKYYKLVEPASIDEFYFDLSFCASLRGGRNRRSNPEYRLPRRPAGLLAMTEEKAAWKEAEKICFKIKKEIKSKFKITCSVGIGPNKLIAKIAAGVKKPDGLYVVKDGEKFLEPLPIREIPGIGPKTELLLNKENVKIVKDLKNFSKGRLKNILGKWGEDLYYKVRGIDDSLIVENREVKSIGEQATFQHDTLSAVYVGEVFENLCKNVFLRFKNSGFKSFKTIAITVRFSGFETKTSAKTLKNPTDSEKEFKLEALKLLLPYLDRRKNPQKKALRLVGVKMEKFDVEELTLGI